ncbi:MAG: Ig-like domain repeat protein, partial [Treponema sp.]|nr:Ig-like domain repeat protein [Treponema sp.]
MTDIEVYDEDAQKVVFNHNQKDSFSLNNFIALPKNITITVLIECWRFIAVRQNLVYIVPDILFTSKQFSIKYHADTTAPAVTISSGGQIATGELYTSQSPLELTGSAVDGGSGVDHNTWQYSTDGGSTWSAEGATTQMTVTKEGKQDVRFRVKDKVGNIGVASVIRGLDRTPPVVSLSASPSAEWSSGSVIVTASATDTLTGVNADTWQYSTDNGSTWSAEGITRQVTITKEGKHDVRFRVKDKVGNIGVASIIRGIDKTPPVVSLSASPSADWTNGSAVTVTASATDPLAGITATTWQYSTDGGSTWSAEGTTTQVTITKEGRHDVRFKVKDKAGNSGVASIVFGVDRTSPVVSLTSSVSADWTNGSGVTITASATDPLAGVNANTWQYSTDGGATWRAEGTSAQVTVTKEGKHDVRFRVKDKAGNSGVASVVRGVDRTPPVVSLTASASADWTNGSMVTVTASATDSLAGVTTNTWQYSTDGGSTWSAEGATTQASITKEGRHDVRFRVKDKAGNSGVASIVRGIDRTLPVVSLAASVSAAWTNGSGVTVTASATDTLAGVTTNTWQYSTDGGSTWSAEGTSAQVSITNEGRRDVRFRVKDKAGNSGVASIIRGVDRTPPALKIEGDLGDAWTAKSNHSLRITTSDALSGMASLEYSRNNGSTWTNLSLSQTTLNVTGEGKQTVVFRAKDTAGNTSSVSVHVNIDATPPSYAIAADGCARREGSGWVIPLKVSGLSDAGSGIDYASFKYALDGGAETKVPGSYSGSAFAVLINAASLSGGKHSIKLTAADKAGNAATQTIAFSVDAAPPVITGGSPLGDTANGAPWTNQDRFSYAIADTETGIKSSAVTVNIVVSTGYVSPFSGYSNTGTALVFGGAAPDGTYQVSFKATDNANNTVERIFYYRLDRTPPDITATLIKSASRSVTIRGTDALSGLNSGNCWTSAVAGVSDSSGYTVNLSDGKHEKEFTLKDIAGNSVTKKVTIYVDQSPPKATVTAPEYVNAETLPVTINLTSAVVGISEAWYLLDGVKTTLGKANWNSCVIPLSSCAEGIHTIKVGAMNEVGISGESASRQFIIDKTPPQLKGYELREAAHPEHIIAEGDYTPGGGVRVKIVGEDLYADGAKKNQGVIKAYSWAVTRKLSDKPIFASANRSAGNEFTVQNFSDGFNCLCVQAEDGAGNQSQILKITVLQDQSSPGAPVIKSSTHAEALRTEQAGFLSRAEFNFAPALGMRSGIRAYQWKAEKLYVRNNTALSAVLVREGETAAIDQEGRGGLSIELVDNDENEFYQLLARCVGGNGKTGPWTTYRFRIDSEAPGGLIVQAVPQADGSSWHNQWDVLARWNKPQDMTGVAEYRHIVLDEEENRASPLENRDTSSWSKTEDTQIKVNLRNIPGAKKSGKLWIGVSAVDYAGNEKLGQLSFNYDFIPPQFNQSALVISNAEDAMGAGKRIRWGGMRDAESGPDRVVILVSSGDKTSAVSVEPELTEYIVSPLEENKAFTVVVRAYDRAGNHAELYDVCATGNAAIPSVYYIPYLETINGYEISGKKRIEGGKISFEGITLQIPEALEFSVIVNTNGAKNKSSLEEVPLGAITAKDGVFQAGRSGSGSYELRSGEFVLEASALSFSRDGGLVFENASYVRPVIVTGAKQDRTISLGSVNAGNPPLIQFSSGSSVIGVEARIESACAETSGGEAQSGFTLTGVNSLFLSGGREWFEGDGISFDRKPLTDMAIRLGDAQGKAPLRNSAMEAGSKNLAALLDITAQSPLSLAMGDAVYRVTKAGIRGNLLDIYEAVLLLPEGYEPAELTVRNITIDTRAKVVRPGPDFSAENIVVTLPDGAVFEGTMIRIDSRGNLLVTGAIVSQAYGIYRTEDLLLSNTGIDWDAGAEITEFTTEIHGFPISAQKARVTTSGIFISEGKIDIWGNQMTVVALGLRNDRKDAVWKEGIISGIFSGDPGYGAAVQLSGGTIADDGVFADAKIPLGNSVVDATGTKHWTLPKARLYPHSAMTGSFAGEKTLVVANTTVKAENCFFDEQGLWIGKAQVEHIPNVTPDTVVFTGMGLAYQGVSVEGVSENEFLFAASGWEIRYASLGFDGQGIKGRGSLGLPETLGGLALVFPETRITAEGLLASGSPDETREILRFRGLPVFADGVALKFLDGAYVLELASPRISLKPINGPDIFFGKTIFDAEGKVLRGDNETRKADFTSFNGYRIELESSRIDDKGFLLSGSVSLRLFGKDVVVSRGTFRALPDLSVSGTGPETELVYSFGDWSISGRDIAFDADRIRILSNRVLFREIEFDIGEIAFGIDGRLLQNVVQKQEIGVSLFGPGATIAETRLSAGGIEAAVIIALPSILGGQSFVFDKVGFRANGDFWVETKVDKFSFAALGFSFALEELTLDSLGLQAAKTLITLPESMQSVSFSVQDLRITSDGRVGMGNAEVSPFALWNMNFNLNSFSIVDGEASFRGKVSLPPALPGELSNREIQIQDFRASLGGGITAMDICLEGDYTIPLGSAWNLLCRNVRISHSEGQPWISADRTELLFPKEYEAKNGYVEQVKFNPLTGQFVFSEISLPSDISMNFGGVNFTLSKLKIDSQFSLAFGGSARFPDSGLPDFLAGKTVAFNRFEINSDGTLGEIDVKLEGLEGAVVPGFDGLVLKKGAISLLKEGNKSLLLSV